MNLPKECLENFKQLFETRENYDVIIRAGEEPNQKDIYAHSVILRCQSNYFRAAFSTKWAEINNGKYFFNKSNISPHILDIILRFLYCGRADLSDVGGSDILKLLVATDELGLSNICEYSQKFLIHEQKKFLNNGAVEIIVQYEAFTILKDYCLEIICRKPMILFGTDKILTLPAHILELLLLQDNLALDEIEVWNNLIKWAHAQNPTIENDPSKWTNVDFTLMGDTISKFIPLIRFQDISSKEYFYKVAPYEKLLSDRLRFVMLRFYMISADVKQIESIPSRGKFINAINIKLFAGWISKKGKALKRSPYKFNLILRGSRDGFDARSFHKKCDNKGATIVVAKIKKSNQIVGGYNPLDWVKQQSFFQRSGDFIFSFKNYKNIKTGRMGRTSNYYYHKNSKSYGPYFGDIMMAKCGKWKSRVRYYPDLDIPREFDIDDYEVYQVILQN